MHMIIDYLILLVIIFSMTFLTPTSVDILLMSKNPNRNTSAWHHYTPKLTPTVPYIKAWTAGLCRCYIQLHLFYRYRVYWHKSAHPLTSTGNHTKYKNETFKCNAAWGQFLSSYIFKCLCLQILFATFLVTMGLNCIVIHPSSLTFVTVFGTLAWCCIEGGVSAKRRCTGSFATSLRILEEYLAFFNMLTGWL